jgi:hypothetical protein
VLMLNMWAGGRYVGGKVALPMRSFPLFLRPRGI